MINLAAYIFTLLFSRVDFRQQLVKATEKTVRKIIRILAYFKQVSTVLICYWKYNFFMTPQIRWLVCWLVGWLIGRSDGIISFKGGKLNFHASIRALVSTQICANAKTLNESWATVVKACEADAQVATAEAAQLKEKRACLKGKYFSL